MVMNYIPVASIVFVVEVCHDPVLVVHSGFGEHAVSQILRDHSMSSGSHPTKADCLFSSSLSWTQRPLFQPARYRSNENILGAVEPSILGVVILFFEGFFAVQSNSRHNLRAVNTLTNRQAVRSLGHFVQLLARLCGTAHIDELIVRTQENIST
jgi:hypothetical protein